MSSRIADVEVAVSGAEEWTGRWEHTGGSWARYALEVSVDGQPIGTVGGWHFVGPWGPDPKGAERWEVRDDDGAFRGLPSVWVGGDNGGIYGHCGLATEGVRISPGESCGGDLAFPASDPAGHRVAYDLRAIEGEIVRAASKAAKLHGDEPDWSSLTPRRVVDSITIELEGGDEMDVEILYGAAAEYECDETDDDSPYRPKRGIRGWAEAWSHSLAEDGETWETAAEAVADAQSREVRDRALARQAADGLEA